ncbi:hypothetical protein HK099_003832 [Clydaea vesicula]|uniref:tRNA(Phe) 7-[(3-amino-3-carboxypropyl)-4-demethylwyosine(37)-N(4)]-methyltransferase n=1 Tax=Clydaea vesicula TaxID=447962 RepID=A0AAD5U1B5_9FUNG|nr:hypothetical protein HK099_003832 [Clydaea vesicula]
MNAKKIFHQRKVSILKEISQSTPDKSSKGFVDEPVKFIIDLINQNERYVTTSSCSGRIAIYKESLKHTKGGNWLFVSHSKVHHSEFTSDKVLRLVFGEDCNNIVEDNDKEDESFEANNQKYILHVECINLESAIAFMNICINSGYKETFIKPGKRIILQLKATLKIDTPIAKVLSKGFEEGEESLKLLVSKNYLRTLISLSNLKFEENERRRKVLESAIEEFYNLESIKEHYAA